MPTADRIDRTETIAATIVTPPAPGRRRALVALGSALALRTLDLRAQARVRRVAFLSGGSRADASEFLLPSFVQGLAALGYSEGTNFVLDARFGDYSDDKTNALARDIAAQNPAVIVAVGNGIAAAYRLSPPIPVVFLISGDPVEAGFANSYARPGRHATGISLLALDLIAKRLEILRQIDPRIRRIAFLASPEHAGQKFELEASQVAAKRAGVDVLTYEARTPAELAARLTSVASQRPDGALLFSDALMAGQRRELATFFLAQRIPSAAGWAGFPEAGHLMSYGAERNAAWRRLAYFVDAILKGARPGDLPVELPTVFELVVNRKTAAAMGLPLSPAMLARADRLVDS